MCAFREIRLGSRTILSLFVRDETENAIFYAAPPPSRHELDRVLERVRRRASAWLVRHGHVDNLALEARSNETPSPKPLDACADLAMQRGTTATMREDGEEEEAEEGSGARSAREHEAADHEGFNLHASVRIEAADDLGRERLCRYCARPPLRISPRPISRRT